VWFVALLCVVQGVVCACNAVTLPADLRLDLHPFFTDVWADVTIKASLMRHAPAAASEDETERYRTVLPETRLVPNKAAKRLALLVHSSGNKLRTCHRIWGSKERGSNYTKVTRLSAVPLAPHFRHSLLGLGSPAPKSSSGSGAASVRS